MYLNGMPRNPSNLFPHRRTCFHIGVRQFVYLKSGSVAFSLFVFTSAHLFPHRGATLGGYSGGLVSINRFRIWPTTYLFVSASGGYSGRLLGEATLGNRFRIWRRTYLSLRKIIEDPSIRDCCLGKYKIKTLIGSRTRRGTNGTI